MISRTGKTVPMGQAEAELPVDAPQESSLAKRILAGLPSALAVAPNPFNAQSDEFGQSFFGSALGTYQAVGQGRQAAEEQAYQRSVTGRRLSLQERIAGAAERRAGAAEMAAQRPIGGRRPVSEELELTAGRQGILQPGRMELERLRQQGATRRKGMATPRAPTPGGITAVDRAILKRYDDANQAGLAAVQAAEKARTAGSVDPATGEMTFQPLTEADRQMIHSQAAHTKNPTFSADSAAAVDRILPQTRGAPNVTKPQGIADVVNRIQRILGGKSGTRGVPTVTPPLDSISPEEALSEDEIDDYLQSIARLDDDDAARAALEAAGLEPGEVEQVMARRP